MQQKIRSLEAELDVSRNLNESYRKQVEVMQNEMIDLRRSLVSKMPVVLASTPSVAVTNRRSKLAALEVQYPVLQLLRSDLGSARWLDAWRSLNTKDGFVTLCKLIRNLDWKPTTLVPATQIPQSVESLQGHFRGTVENLELEIKATDTIVINLGLMVDNIFQNALGYPIIPLHPNLVKLKEFSRKEDVHKNRLTIPEISETTFRICVSRLQREHLLSLPKNPVLPHSQVKALLVFELFNLTTTNGELNVDAETSLTAQEGFKSGWDCFQNLLGVAQDEPLSVPTVDRDVVSSLIGWMTVDGRICVWWISPIDKMVTLLDQEMWKQADIRLVNVFRLFPNPS